MSSSSQNIPQAFEERYHSQILPQFKVNNARGILLINIVSLLFIFSDSIISSNSTVFNNLLTIRLSFLLISFGFYISFQKEINYKTYSYLTLLLTICLTLLNLSVQWFMPSNHLINFGVEVAILLSFSIFFRNKRLFQALSSILFIIVTITFNVLYKDYTNVEHFIITISFISFMLIGLLTAVYIDRVNRRIYSLLDNELKIKNELSDALKNIKQLKGLIPICSTCHKIKNERGNWDRLEKYIQNHSSATFSHSICTDCSNSLLNEADKEYKDA